MSAEYSVEKIEESVTYLSNQYARSHDRRDAVACAQLQILAERIKADEVAVPVAYLAENANEAFVFFANDHESLDAYTADGFSITPLVRYHRAQEAEQPHPPAQAAQVDGRMSYELRNFIEGMSVSVDVSIGDADAGHRYFGTVTEVMDCADDKHGVTLLVQDAEPNFKAEKPVSSAAIEALRDVDHVVTQWRESGREPAYGQWLTLQDVVRAALAAEPVAHNEDVVLAAIAANPDDAADQFAEPAAQDDGMCNADNPARRCVCREEFGRRVCAPVAQGEAADPLADDSPLQSCRAFVESWRLESAGSNGHDVIANRNTVRRLVHIIDHLAAQPRAVPDGMGEAVLVPRETLLAIVSALDVATGDSDPNIDPDMTDDEVRDEYPEVWAMQQLSGLITTSPAQPRAVPADFAEYLKDPTNVHVMMLRGVIAIPSIRSIVHLRGEVPNGEDAQLARIAELQEQVATLKDKPAERVPDAIVELVECSKRGWNDSAPAYRAGGNDCRDAYFAAQREASQINQAQLTAAPSPGESNNKPTDCSGDPLSCPDNEGRGCYCSDLRRAGESV